MGLLFPGFGVTIVLVGKRKELRPLRSGSAGVSRRDPLAGVSGFCPYLRRSTDAGCFACGSKDDPVSRATRGAGKPKRGEIWGSWYNPPAGGPPGKGSPVVRGWQGMLSVFGSFCQFFMRLRLLRQNAELRCYRGMLLTVCYPFKATVILLMRYARSGLLNLDKTVSD